MPDDGNPSRDRSNDEPNKHHHSEHENPFIAFRRFADEQVHSILNSIVGLPLVQDWNDERIKEWKAWVIEAGGQQSKQGAISNPPQDQRSRRVMGSPAREDKPKAVETEDGGKMWTWSWSWPRPSKDGSKPEESNNLDATQKKALEEARQNAEKEFRQLEAMFKSWWQSEASEEAKNEAKSLFQSEASEEEKKGSHDFVAAVKSSLLDEKVNTSGEPVIQITWSLPTQQKPNVESEIGKSDQATSKGLRERLGGRHHDLSHSRESDDYSVIAALLDHRGFPSFVHPHVLRFVRHRFGDCRMRWLLSHPYSPVVLEAENIRTNPRGPNYVAAFEDLLRVEQGLDIDEGLDWERYTWPRRMRLMSLVHNLHPRTQAFWNNMHEGGDWYVPKPGLNAAKSLPRSEVPNEEMPQKSSADHDRTYERFLGNSNAEPKTELDAYEQLLLGSSSSPSIPVTKQQKAEKPGLDVVEASPILSTVTTTERTVLADGTVTMKIVLRKRFADGREESSETVNTTKSDDASPPQAAEQTVERNNNRGGWFWSK